MKLKTTYVTIIGHTSFQSKFQLSEAFESKNGDLKTIFHCSSLTFHRAAETAVLNIIIIV